jgi:hypothetical protein
MGEQRQRAPTRTVTINKFAGGTGGTIPPKFGVGDKVSYIPQYFHGAKDDF